MHSHCWHYPKKTSSTFRNFKLTQLVSFTSNPFILPLFLMSSIGSQYIKELFIKLLLSCINLFLIFLHAIYSLWIWVNQSAKDCTHNTIWTFHTLFKNLWSGFFCRWTTYVYGKIFLFRPGTLNNLIVSKKQLKTYLYPLQILFLHVILLKYYCTLRPRKKKGLSHETARISMWTHFYRIALRAESNLWLFFFFKLPRKKNGKKRQKKKKKKEPKTL